MGGAVLGIGPEFSVWLSPQGSRAWWPFLERLPVAHGFASDASFVERYRIASFAG